MQAKNVLYAAVGAPVAAAKKVSGTVGTLRTRLTDEAGDYTKAAEKAMEGWAKEGEKIVSRVADNDRVEELTSRVDLDQAKEQVGKLRTQLEDMLDTWRSSFRPEKAVEKVEVTEATKPAPKTSAKPAAKKPAAKKPAAKKPAAKKTTAKKPAAKKTTKTSTAKTTSSTAKKTGSTKATAKAS
jgi:hypothetical protein